MPPDTHVPVYNWTLKWIFFFFLEVFFISVTLTLRIAILYSLIVERLFGWLPRRISTWS